MGKGIGLFFVLFLLLACLLTSAVFAEAIKESDPPGTDSAVVEAAALPIESVATQEDLRPFGYEFFAGAPTSFTIAPDAPVSDSYVLDKNDVLRIRYWSPSIPEVTYELKVSENGNVALPGIGDIKAGGYTVAQFRDRVRARVSEQIKNASTSVELEQTRTIEVYVSGAAKRPGRYTLKAQSNLFNVIYAAGGAAEEGSLRKIAVIRNGKTIATTDIYKFLINGTIDTDILLNDQDTVFFPMAGARVAVRGQVVRPAIYEVGDSARLSEVLNMAGGLKPSAYSRIVRVERVDAGRRVELTVDANAVMAKQADAEDILLRDGDALNVELVSGRVADKVSIKGYVQYPGSYSLLRTPTVKALLEEAKLQVGAYSERADLMRTLEDGTPVIVPIPLRDLLEGRGKDVDLTDRDEVVVYGKDEKIVVPVVTISGPVKNPATFRLAENMRAADLIFAAGGLLQDASREVAHLYKRIGPNKFKLVRIVPASLNEDAANPMLSDQDRLVIYSQSEVEFKNTKISVLGEVQKPGEFEYFEGMTLYDLVVQAGGPTDMASGTVEVARPVDSSENQATSVSSFSIQDVMAGAKKDEPVEAGMLVSLPRKQNRLTEPLKVELRGQFKRPGTYALLSEDETLESLIKRAGGLAENSDPFGISLTRRQNQMLSAATSEQIKTVLQTMDQLLPSPSPQEPGQTSSQVEIMDSSSSFSQMTGGSRAGEKILLISPRRLSGAPTGNRISFTLEDRTKYLDRIGQIKMADGDVVEVPKLSNVVQVLGAVQSPGPVFYAGGLSAAGYIDRAGGGAPDADLKRAVVIKVSGAVHPLGRTKTIDPGDVIVVASKYQAIQPSGQRTFTSTLADLLGIGLIIKAFD